MTKPTGDLSARHPHAPFVIQRLQICVLLVGKRLVRCVRKLSVVLLHEILVNLDLGRSKGDIGNEFLYQC